MVSGLRMIHSPEIVFPSTNSLASARNGSPSSKPRNARNPSSHFSSHRIACSHHQPWPEDDGAAGDGPPPRGERTVPLRARGGGTRIHPRAAVTIIRRCLLLLPPKIPAPVVPVGLPPPTSSSRRSRRRSGIRIPPVHGPSALPLPAEPRCMLHLYRLHQGQQYQAEGRPRRPCPAHGRCLPPIPDAVPSVR